VCRLPMLREVRVTRNRTEPRATSSSPSGVPCPTGDCPCAYSAGGGIASWGNISLGKLSRKSQSRWRPCQRCCRRWHRSELGTLTLQSSAVVDNHTAPVDIGRFAEGGGVFVESGDLTLRNSTVSANRAELVTSWESRPDGSRRPDPGEPRRHPREWPRPCAGRTLQDQLQHHQGRRCGGPARRLRLSASAGRRGLTMRHRQIKRNIVWVRGATSADASQTALSPSSTGIPASATPRSARTGSTPTAKTEKRRPTAASPSSISTAPRRQ
jgi:hypothetical protein